MKVELKNTKQKVEFLIRKFPKLRDSDQALWIHLIRTEIPWRTMNGEEVLRAISDGQCTNPESVRRVRAKLNEKDPTTRGKSWKKRQEKGEVIREQIRHL